MSIRTLISALILLCFAVDGNAGVTGKRKGITLGFVGGMSMERSTSSSAFATTGRADNQSNIDRVVRSGSSLGENDWGPIEASGGAFLNFALSENLGIQPELLYLRDRIGSYWGNIVVGFIEAPVLLTYTPHVSNKFIPTIMGGVYSGFSISSKYENQSKGQSYPSISASTYESISRSSGYIPFRIAYGVMLGGGLGMATGNGTVILNARYILGKTRVTQSGYPATTDNNRMLQLFAGYSFKI